MYFETSLKMAVWTGLEPATPCVTGRYSNQLNYHTINVFFSEAFNILNLRLFGGMDGTRTRDPLRDRQVF